MQVDRVEIAGQVVVPPCPQDVHPLAQDFYEGLQSSGQVRWFEPSDWARARVFTLLLSQQLRSARPSATMYAALQKDMDALLVSEAERRRVRMELDRAPVDIAVAEAKVAQMARYRQAAGTHPELPDTPPAG